MVAFNQKGNEGTLWDMENVLYRDWDAGCVGVYICQYSLNYSLKIIYFIVWEFTSLKKKNLAFGTRSGTSRRLGYQATFLKSSSLANPVLMSATNFSQTMVGLSWGCYTLLRKLLENAPSGSCLTVGFWERWAWDKDLNADGLPGRWAQEVGVRKQEEWAGERGKVSPESPCWRQLGLDFTGSCEQDMQFLPELSRKEDGLGLCHQLLPALVGAFWIWAELSYHLEKDPRQKTREPWAVLLKVKCRLCDSELNMGWFTSAAAGMEVGWGLQCRPLKVSAQSLHCLICCNDL